MEPLESFVRHVREQGWRVVTAESCTGGLVAATLTAEAGSSDWFEGGVVAYSNRLKQQLLGVPEALLDEHGAVSDQVVRSMALGALERCSGTLALAVSGIAGPGGGTLAKPVGTVYLGWAWRHSEHVLPVSHAMACRFLGNRDAVRQQSVQRLLEVAQHVTLMQPGSGWVG